MGCVVGGLKGSIGVGITGAGLMGGAIDVVGGTTVD